jgi:photosystem II stability/assembly factor-like uncharacterized protein
MKNLFLLLLVCPLWTLSQTTVSSATFGALEARQLGPGTMSGRITAIDGLSSDNGKTLYIGTAGGGIWKTTNAGASFKPIFDKYCQSIGALAIDQKNPKTIYVGTGESNMRNSVSIGDGFYKTTDGGDNWTRLGGLDSTEHISKVVLDPNNSNVIYVAAPGALWGNSKHRGLYKSTDGGKTFEKILFISDKAGCADVMLDPKDPNIVYASTWEFRRQPYSFNSGGEGSAMWKSIDGGKTWRELKTGLPAKPFGRIAMALSPSEPNKLLAIVESTSTGLYISSDGGENWKQQSSPLNVVARPFYFSTLVVDPFDSKRVYRPAYQFSFSDDGGYSFTQAGGEGAIPHADHHALWINPKNTNHLYLGTDGGVYMSLDRGSTWTYLQNLPVGQFYHVAVDQKTPYRVYGGLQDNGSWAGPSSAPGGVKNSDWLELYGGDGFWVTPDPVDENIVYAESQGGDVNRIDLRNFKSISVRPQASGGDEKLRWNWNTPIVTGASNKKNLYVGAQYLYRSTDQGRSWTKISGDLTTNDKTKQQQENSGGISADVTSAENHCTIFSVAESPLDENTIWVGTDDGNLQVTTDGGKTWTNVSKNYTSAGIPTQTWVSSIEPSRFDKNTVYASFDNHMYGDHKTYVAKSTDLGKTWTLLKSDEFTGFAHKVKEDLKNKDLLFLGTEMGLFGSIDGGQHWFRMKNNIPWYALVRDIQIHPVTNDLVLATHGRGIMIVDDISNIRALTKEVLEKDVHLFAVKPLVLTTGVFGNGGTSVQGAWTAPNAPAIPPFYYYLKERVNTGVIKLDIFDTEGKLVQSIPGTNRKGINKISWNLRGKGPKTAAGTKPDYGTFVAPQVLPGTYSMKLKVGEKEYSQPLVIEHDAASAFTLADRKLQYQTAMELFHLHERLAKDVDSLNASLKMLKEAVAKEPNAKKKKKIQDKVDKLETLKGELVPVKQNSMFADETRLRDEISDVYRAICSGETVPSNLQLERIQQLKARVEEGEKRMEAVLSVKK